MWDPQVCVVCLSLGAVFGVGWAALYWLDDFIHKRRRPKQGGPDRMLQDRPLPE